MCKEKIFAKAEGGGDGDNHKASFEVSVDLYKGEGGGGVDNWGEIRSNRAKGREERFGGESAERSSGVRFPLSRVDKTEWTGIGGYCR